VLDTIYQSILEGHAAETVAGVQQVLDAGLDPGQILDQAMIAAMAEVGRRFEAGDMYVPEMLIAARAMKQGLAVLKPRLLEADIDPVGKVVMGTVQGDLHDIGKNLVATMLEGNGFEVIDLGVDVAPEGFADAVRDHQPHLVGLSALLTTTMPGMEIAIQALERAGLRNQVAVMIGGAPVSQQFADDIGADLYAPDASAAASRARALLEK
jgi:5-methyltetrahydrofolate--homocysteine methyltransferase